MEAPRGDAGLSDNVEVVKRFLAAFEAGDDEGQRAFLHPDVELTEWPEAPDSHHVRGIDDVERTRDAWFEAWESLDFVVDEYIEAGDRVVSCGRAHALGRGSTVPVDFDNFIIKCEPLPVPEPSTAALAALGLGCLVILPARKARRTQ